MVLCIKNLTPCLSWTVKKIIQLLNEKIKISCNKEKCFKFNSTLMLYFSCKSNVKTKNKLIMKPGKQVFQEYVSHHLDNLLRIVNQHLLKLETKFKISQATNKPDS